MAEKFGCCSKRDQCSDILQCIYKDDPEYSQCGYRKNLEAGRIFYGKNAGKKPEPKIIPNWAKPEYHIYLTCYNQPFAVLARNKVGLSYQLKEESFNKLKNLFDALQVPYITDLSQGEFIDKETKEKQICNYRVTIEAGDDKYNVLNFDSLLVPEKVARGIQKAFEVRGIPAKAEQYGRYNVVDIPPYRAGLQEVKIVEANVEPEAKPIKEKKIVYEQSSIFDLMGA